METVASRELRNNTRSLLDRVSTGEHVTIAVNGRPVAVLSPPPSTTKRWIPKGAFLEQFVFQQADHQLSADLADLSPDTTDDLPL